MTDFEEYKRLSGKGRRRAAVAYIVTTGIYGVALMAAGVAGCAVVWLLQMLCGVA